METRHKLPGLGSPVGDPGPGLCCVCFYLSRCVIIRRVHKLTLSDPVQVTLKLKVSLSDLVSRFLSGPTLLGGGGANFFFHLGPTPLLAALFPFAWALAVRNYVLSYSDSGPFIGEIRLRTGLRTHKVLGMSRMPGLHIHTLNFKPLLSQLKELLLL